MDSLLDRVTCVRCAGALDPRAASIACAKCGQAYPRIARIPVLLPQPDAHIELWRGQLALLLAQAGDTLSNIEAAAAAADVLADGRARLHALARGVRQQVEDIAQIVGAALGGPSST